MKAFDVAVIGAGPAGMAATVELASRGVRVALLDEQPRCGGKIGAHIREGSADSDAASAPVRWMNRRFGEALRSYENRIACLFGIQVWHVDADHTLYLCTNHAPKPVSKLEVAGVILAQGAVERHVPFFNWTLPGVLSVGGLGLFVKQGAIPKRRIWIAGSGPLQLALTRDLCAAGHPPSGLSVPFSRSELVFGLMRFLPWMGIRRMQTMALVWGDVMRTGIPVFFRTVVDAAQGRGQLSAIDLRAVDGRWRPLPMHRRGIPADILAIGYGIVPSSELSRRCGCLHAWDEHAACWKPLRDRWLETSVSGLWSVGDGAGILGAEASWMEGRIAGIAAAAFVGKEKAAAADREINLIRKRLIPHRRMGRWIEALSKPRPGIYETISADTVVCRCEGVRAQDIRKAVVMGAMDIGEVKRRTRLGMGSCQDRICSQTIHELIARYRKGPLEREMFFPRIPARPVRFADMAGMDSEDGFETMEHDNGVQETG